MDDQTRMVLQTVSSTYEGHVASYRGYGWRPLTYEVWKIWHDHDNNRLGPITKKD